MLRPFLRFYMLFSLSLRHTFCTVTGRLLLTPNVFLRFIMSSCVEFVLLDRNDINGTMDSVCKSSVLKLAAADCTTEVECSCCDLCCADEEDCHDMGLVNTVDWETNYDRIFFNFGNASQFYKAIGPDTP